MGIFLLVVRLVRLDHQNTVPRTFAAYFKRKFTPLTGPDIFSYQNIIGKKWVHFELKCEH